MAYIEIDEFKRKLIDEKNFFPAIVARALDEMPTADVVEVVRCKDCNHAISYSCKNDACYKVIMCEYKIATVDENFYCACAEPRTPKERGEG